MPTDRKAPGVIGIQTSRKFKSGASTNPEPPDPTSPSGCRPCSFILDLRRDNIITAVRRGRSYRSIAAQYGVSAMEVWNVVAVELAERKAA